MENNTNQQLQTAFNSLDIKISDICLKAKENNLHTWNVNFELNNKNCIIEVYMMNSVEKPNGADILVQILNTFMCGEISFADFCNKFGFNPNDPSSHIEYFKDLKSLTSLVEFLGEERVSKIFDPKFWDTVSS